MRPLDDDNNIAVDDDDDDSVQLWYNKTQSYVHIFENEEPNKRAPTECPWCVFIGFWPIFVNTCVQTHREREWDDSFSVATY